MPIPLPPLGEQEQIIDTVDERLTQIHATEQAADTAASRSNPLRQSILKCAFEGKLVPQDANDEPAAVLLARIRKQREVETANKLPRSRSAWKTKRTRTTVSQEPAD